MSDARSSPVARAVERAFPGLAPRTLFLGLFVALVLTVYWRHGGLEDAPRALSATLSRATGIQPAAFFHHAYAHAAAFVLLFLVPLAVGRAMGMGPRALGLGIRGARREVLIALGLWIAFLPVVWIASRSPSFLVAYPRLRAMSTDPGLFLLYQAVYGAKWIAWEFFFRGFVLFGFEKDLGAKAVILSTIPFVLMHYTKPEAEMLGAILAGPLLCALAMRSRSVWPGVLLHWLVAASMDLLASRFWR